jgi:hypothetical protein
MGPGLLLGVLAGEVELKTLSLCPAFQRRIVFKPSMFSRIRVRTFSAS